ncbi:MAG: ferric reductase-like transmembrane domain-containing protein [Candidatus Magasanikiibacteriota bacterium]
MSKIKILSKISILSVLILISIFVNSKNVLAVSTTTTANLYTESSPPLDTDIDGLTDQGETNIFGTDPLSPDTDGDGYLDGAEVLSKSDPLDYYSPGTIAEVAQEQAKTKEVPWAWYSTRAAGIISYILLFLISVSGIALSTGLLYKFFGQVWGWRIHQWIGIFMILSLVGHVVALAFDKFVIFSIAELLIPFASDYKPILVALGIISFYFFIILISTSLFVIQTKYKLWRKIHYLSFPMFVGAFIHSIYLGTDSHTLPMLILYWSTGIILIMFVVYRMVYSHLPGKSKVEHNKLSSNSINLKI